MEYTHAFGPHWHWSWIVPFLFMILMFVFASRMCRRMGAWRCSAGHTGRGRFGCCGPGQGSTPDRWSETPDQILDFGLAKNQPLDFSNSSETSAPTLGHSQPGAVMGTIGYMSPEQARGHPVDQRSDLFSLGTVIYEMISGRRPFEGKSSADEISAILREDPPPCSSTRASIPLAFDRVVGRCLEKDVRSRFQTASDLLFALGSVHDHDTGISSFGGLTADPSADIPIQSIAVLPFANMGGCHPSQSSQSGRVQTPDRTNSWRIFAPPPLRGESQPCRRTRSGRI